MPETSSHCPQIQTQLASCMEIDGDNEQIDLHQPAPFIATGGPRDLQEEEMTQIDRRVKNPSFQVIAREKRREAY